MTSCIGSLSIVTPRWTASVVVDVDPLDRGRPAVEHAVVGVGRGPRAAARAGRRAGTCAPSTSPRARSRARPGAGAAGGSPPAASDRAARSDLLGRRRAARVDHLAHRRIARRDLLALGVARARGRAAAAPPRSRCRRRGRRGSPARAAGGRGGRSPRRARRRRPALASTGQVLTFSQPGLRAARRSGRRAHAEHDVRGEQRALERLGAVEPPANGVSLCTAADASRSPDRSRRDAPRSRRGRSRLERRRVAARASTRRSIAWWRSPVACRKRTSASTRGRVRRRAALDLQVVEGRAVALRSRRVDDPERRRRRVLRRARACRGRARSPRRGATSTSSSSSSHRLLAAARPTACVERRQAALDALAAAAVERVLVQRGSSRSTA